MKCDENDDPSINIDSLLNAYKQDEKDKDMSIKSDDVQEPINVPDILQKNEMKTGILKLVKFEKSNNEVNGKQNNVDLEETNKHVSFKKQGLDRVRSVTIKNKHQILREDRTSKILAPVLKVLFHVIPNMIIICHIFTSRLGPVVRKNGEALP